MYSALDWCAQTTSQLVVPACQPPKKLLHHNVGADVAKWNPHKSHCNYVASTVCAMPCA